MLCGSGCGGCGGSGAFSGLFFGVFAASDGDALLAGRSRGPRRLDLVFPGALSGAATAVAGSSFASLLSSAATAAAAATAAFFFFGGMFDQSWVLLGGTDVHSHIDSSCLVSRAIELRHPSPPFSFERNESEMTLNLTRSDSLYVSLFALIFIATV